MQITGGIWRGRKLPPAPKGVRPTTARARGTLFNWLGQQLDGQRCLDLFAGSGGLSLEALSRGAQHATLLEIGGKACGSIRRNSQLLECQPQLRLVHTDSSKWLHRVPVPEQPWDLIFVDPPYDAPALTASLHLLHQRQLVSEGSMLYLETAAQSPPAPDPWQLQRQSLKGDCWMRLYRLNSSP